MGRNSVHWLRIEAALAGERHDAIPVSLWKHYHLLDRAPGQLARRTDEFHRQFGFDLAKLTPSGLYGVQDWGVGIQFGRHDDEAPTVIASPVGLAADWKSLPALEPETGALGRELEMCSRVRELWGDGVPYMMTIFSPITLAHKIAGDRVYEHMRHDPALLHAGLRTIRDTVVRYVRACNTVGVPGYFLATQQASRDVLSPEEYREFGLAYDADIASELGDSAIRMLHVCGSNIMLDEAAQLDVNCLSWSAGGGNPDVAEARSLTDKALAAGLNLETMRSGTEDDNRAMVAAQVEDHPGPGLILAPDCVVNGDSPDKNLTAVVDAARDL